MNQINSYIFTLYLYLLNLRDTMEYTIERDHSKEIYDSRKQTLLKGIQEGSALGNFFKQNEGKGEEIKNKIKEFINDVYGDESTILRVSDDKIRVDYTQNIKVFDCVVGLSESVRDIIYGYINLARKNKENDDTIEKLLADDDRLYRSVATMLILKEFNKSFMEFQKVMTESHGDPTPQSNYIVQNEIIKLSSCLRFVRTHHRIIDNETLDLLDEVEAYIQMSEGRRERRDGKTFKELFDSIINKLNAHIGKVEPVLKNTFNEVFKSYVEFGKEKLAA